MATERIPDLRLFFDILLTLDRIDVPYMIIGGFAAAIYGNNRTTYDIDIVVDHGLGSRAGRTSMR